MTDVKQVAADDLKLAAERAQFEVDLAAAKSYHDPDAELPPAEAKALEKKMEATKKFFDLNKKIAATYKIEVQFSRNRTKNEAFAGSLHIYRSGSVLAGGGDEILYPCPDNNCYGVILPEHMGGAIAVCPECHRQFYREKDLSDTRLFRLTYQNWAEVIYKMFIRLGMDADVHLKTQGADIRDATMKEQARARFGDHYLHSRKRITLVYTLENIVKDKHAGADLLGRFRALVVA